MDEIKWQQPPAIKRRQSETKWEKVAGLLRSHPGEWANVGVFAAGSTAAAVRAGVYRGMPRGEFEATARKRKDGQYDIYARFVGQVSR